MPFPPERPLSQVAHPGSTHAFRLMSPRRRLVVLVAAVALTLVVLLLVIATVETLGRRETTQTLYVHVAPDGDDEATGLSPAEPVRTLEQAQRVLDARRGDQPAEVKLAAGRYTTTGLVWSHVRPGWPTRLTGPVGLQEAVLDGAEGEVVLVVRPAAPTSMALTVSRIKIRGAANGVRLQGADDVTFDHVVFYRIGDVHGSGPGYAALGVEASARTRVLRSRFTSIENDRGKTLTLVHGVYAAHGSTGLQVRDSRFSGVSGDPVRTRDASHDALVVDSVFEQSGTKAALSDWFDAPSESPSTGGQVLRSTIGDGYLGEPIVPTLCWTC